jgi:hypothetical protein
MPKYISQVKVNLGLAAIGRKSAGTGESRIKSVKQGLKRIEI